MSKNKNNSPKMEFTDDDLRNIEYIYGKYNTKKDREEYWKTYHENTGKHYEADKGGSVRLVKNRDWSK